MFIEKLKNCPACGKEMELGFSVRSSPLSFVTLDKTKEFVHVDEDLNRAGLKTILPAPASYSAAYHCSGCKILVVDYSEKISSKDAKTHAASIKMQADA